MRPFWKSILLAGALLTAVCGPSQEAHDQALKDVEHLRDSLDELTRIVQELRDTPTERLARARNFQETGDSREAEEELAALVEKYPDSPEAERARSVLDSIATVREQARLKAEREREEELRRKRLGFKALAEESSVEAGNVILQPQRVAIRDRWVVNRYDNRWHYRDARRGHKYLVVDVRVSSDNHDPRLPPIYIYEVSGDKLRYAGMLFYEFYRWKDYGSYLGNYADYGNDFAHSRTIMFTAGLEITNEEAENPLAVVVQDDGCFVRKYKEYQTPEVAYEDSGCDPPPSLSVEEVGGRFTMIEFFNRNKL